MSTAGDVFRIELPDDASAEEAAELRGSLRDVDDIVDTSADTRSLAAALLLVQVIGGALSDIATAVPLVERVAGLIRWKGTHRREDPASERDED
jgi:hypothetical protein